ncbi:MAG: OmpA family protein [Proteobacteria bacterium]|nr:MAG: OmpA family protein [Pseudomonadota bacterium]
MRSLLVILNMSIIFSCSSAPKPPVVDGKDREPINSAAVAELISVRARLAQTEEKLREEKSRPVVSSPAAQIPNASHTFSVFFPSNNANFTLSENDSARLLPMLAKARRVEVRGRTDAKRPSAADEKIALKRAVDAQRYLIEQGVMPSIISVNYVSAGDFIADNVTAIGKAQNRRVDIEIFYN